MCILRQTLHFCIICIGHMSFLFFIPALVLFQQMHCLCTVFQLLPVFTGNIIDQFHVLQIQIDHGVFGFTLADLLLRISDLCQQTFHIACPLLFILQIRFMFRKSICCSVCFIRQFFFFLFSASKQSVPKLHCLLPYTDSGCSIMTRYVSRRLSISGSPSICFNVSSAVCNALSYSCSTVSALS